MGQRYVQLNNTATLNSDGSGTLYVSPLPSPFIMPPGPAYLFVVVNGVPSQGQQIMCGSGQIGAQTVSAVQVLPASNGFQQQSSSNQGATGTTGGTAAGHTQAANVKSAAPKSVVAASSLALVAALVSVYLA